VKWVGVFPGNPALGLPTVSGLIVLDDPATGLPVAVMDATLVTALRTGASAGVAARFLAREGAEVAAIVGCGVQGRAGLRALAAALPGLREVRCRDSSEAAARSFVDELGPLLPVLELGICGSAPEAVVGADVVLTAIPMTGGLPPLDAGLLGRGALAVALDYDAAWSAAAMAECERLVTDDLAQTQAGRGRARARPPRRGSAHPLPQPGHRHARRADRAPGVRARSGCGRRHAAAAVAPAPRQRNARAATMQTRSRGECSPGRDPCGTPAFAVPSWHHFLMA
jgi:ornithine cyclodeaminase/alanine dehydrogenase-like protein (mu-crystallin family)